MCLDAFVWQSHIKTILPNHQLIYKDMLVKENNVNGMFDSEVFVSADVHADLVLQLCYSSYDTMYNIKSLL